MYYLQYIVWGSRTTLQYLSGCFLTAGKRRADSTTITIASSSPRTCASSDVAGRAFLGVALDLQERSKMECER
jgi:hypothetical protein